MVFRSDKQRTGFFGTRGRAKSATQPQLIADSYITGKRLPGKFRSMQAVFRKFPKERVAFRKVKKFNKEFDTRVTTTAEVKDAERRIKGFRRVGNPRKKTRKQVKRRVRGIYG